MDELLARCVVRLSAPGAPGGTGFFVAPGRILTCAHVVDGARTVEVALGSRVAEGTVVATYPPAGGHGLYPYPDLAVVLVDDMCHEVVELDDELPRLDDRLHSLGHGSTLADQGGGLEPATFTFEGLHSVPGGRLLKLGAGAQASPGMSGGPLVNLRTGRVCGVVKTSMDTDLPHGGWAVPIAAAHEFDLVRASDSVPPIPAELQRLLESSPGYRKACADVLATLEVEGFRPRFRHLLALTVAIGAPEGIAQLTDRDATLLVLACASVASTELMAPAGLARRMEVDQDLRRRWLQHVDRCKRTTAREWEKITGSPRPDPARLVALSGDLRPPEHVAVSLFLERELPHVLTAPALTTDPFPSCGALLGLITSSFRDPFRTFVARCVERFDSVRSAWGTHPLFVCVLVRTALTARRLLAAEEGRLTPVPRLLTADHGLWALQRLVTDVHPELEAGGETLSLALGPESPVAVDALLGEVEALRQAVDQGTATLAQHYLADRDAEFRLRCPRIRSNVDDPAHYVRSHGFNFEPLPGRITLNASKTLPLLIQPLYGNNPNIGVRELLQNALDAVWARRMLEGNTLGAVHITLTDGSGEPPPGVAVPEQWRWWIEVRDDGVGMTADIIREHFLTAGGSYDPAAHERAGARAGDPLRIGRFGIGVLAGFLLGREVQVITRHIDADDGLHFVMFEDTDVVELYRCPAEKGAVIRIRLSEEVHAKLVANSSDWDWYHFVDPVVTRVLVHEAAETVLRNVHPLLDKADELLWRRLDVFPYGEVYWCPSQQPDGGSVYVNGVFVIAPDRDSDQDLMEPVHALKIPVISMADRAGVCALNLRRDGFIEYPGEVLEAVRRDALRDQIAWFVAVAAAGRDQRPCWESPVWVCGRRRTATARGVPYVFSDSHLIAVVPELLVAAQVGDVRFILLDDMRELGVSFAGEHRLADLTSLGGTVGLISGERRFGHRLSIGPAASFMFGANFTGAKVMSQLLPIEWITNMGLRSMLVTRQAGDWAVTALRAEHLDAEDLLVGIDRDLLTELGGRGVLRVEPRVGSTPSPLAELASVWQEYELPFALPFGFDCNSLNGPNAQDLRTRVARMRTTLETR